MAECQRWVSSREFAEWMAFYAIERELGGADEEEPPAPDLLGSKITAWAQAMSQRLPK